MTTKTKGYVLGSVAAATYGLNPFFTLPLYEAGMNADSVLFYRYGIAVVMLSAIMAYRRQSFSIKPDEIMPLIAMGMLFSVSSLLLFLSYSYMDAGIASTILFIYPVMVAVIMATIFREKAPFTNRLAMVMAFAGIMLLYRGENGQSLSLKGVVLVLLSSLAYAIYIIGVNRSSLKTMPTEKLTFYVLLSGITIYVWRLNGCTALQPIPGQYLWLNVACLALFPTIISLVSMTISIHYIGSTPAAILGALEPITALLIGIFVFDEQFTLRIALGVILILAAVTLVITGQKIIMRLKTTTLIRHTDNTPEKRM